MRMRRTALTFATCHQARSETSALARATTSRRIRLRRAGMLIRIAATASSGPIAAPRSASTETPRWPVGGGSICSSSAMAHTVHQVLTTPRTWPARYRLHKYWSRKPPDLVAARIAAATAPGDLVLDPFCGSGVAPIEAAALGRRRGRHRRQPVRGLPRARPPPRRAIPTRSPPPARGRWRPRGPPRARWHRTPCRALRRRRGARRARRGGERRSSPSTSAARAAAARAARSRCGPTCVSPPWPTRPATAVRRDRPCSPAGRPASSCAPACATSASCSRPATCARSRRCGPRSWPSRTARSATACCWRSRGRSRRRRG